AAALARHRLDETATQLDAGLRLLDRGAHATDWQARAGDSHHGDIADLRRDVARRRGRVDARGDTAGGVGVPLDRADGGPAGPAEASGLRAEAEGAGAAARRAALRLRAAAAVYEHAELTARRAVTLDDAARTAIDARLAELGPLIALAAAPHGLGFARRAPWE